MSTPFLSELRIFSFNFAPRGWAMCNGQVLSISTNAALFSLIGTTYGGNGTSNFALPNLQGRRPMHVGNNHVLGETAGEDFHSLSVNEMPAHTHTLVVKAAASPAGAVGRLPASTKVLAEPHAVVGAGTPAVDIYGNGSASGQVMAAATIGVAGAGQGHENRQPYLALNICISLTGIYPARN